jgi:hypothetical protein
LKSAKDGIGPVQVLSANKKSTDFQDKIATGKAAQEYFPHSGPLTQSDAVSAEIDKTLDLTNRA